MTDRVSAVLTRPTFDAASAADLLHSAWGIAGELRPLPSERDRNFAVRVDGVDSFVLKISNATDDRELLEFQHLALLRLAAGGVRCPEPVPTPSGEVVVEVGGVDAPILVRLMRWIPGRPLGTVPPPQRRERLFEDLGATMGRTAVALAGWDHPAAHRPFQWNALEGLAVIDAHAPAVTSSARERLLTGWRLRLEPLAGLLPTLRQGVIHNDANDHNVLVAHDESSVAGLLDLGDSVWSVVVNELAVAAAYAALGATEPLAVLRAVRHGFETVLPLTDEERTAIVDLVGLRLATSVSLSAHQSTLDPGDPYLTVSESAAWDLLERLASVDPARATDAVVQP